jgi:hypothetical protein
MSRTCLDPGIVTLVELPVHVSICPSPKASIEETGHEYQCTIWTCVALARGKHTNSFPKWFEKFLHPIGSNPDWNFGRSFTHRVQTQRPDLKSPRCFDLTWSHLVLYASPLEFQRPGTLQNSFAASDRCLHQLVERQSCSSSICTLCALVPEP